MSEANSGKKTGISVMRSPRNGAETPTGRHPGNTGGKKGRSGRKPNAFKDFLQAEIRDNPARRKALAAAAGDRGSRSFGAAWKIATDYDTEKPAEKREISGKLEVRVVMVREGSRRTAG